MLVLPFFNLLLVAAAEDCVCVYQPCGGSEGCCPGTVCKTYGSTSQCEEAPEYLYTTTPSSGPLQCIRTESGYGCTTNSDCCNPSAFCNIHTKQCLTMCPTDEPTAVPTALPTALTSSGSPTLKPSVSDGKPTANPVSSPTIAPNKNTPTASPSDHLCNCVWRDCDPGSPCCDGLICKAHDQYSANKDGICIEDPVYRFDGVAHSCIMSRTEPGCGIDSDCCNPFSHCIDRHCVEACPLTDPTFPPTFAPSASPTTTAPSESPTMLPTPSAIPTTQPTVVATLVPSTLPLTVSLFVHNSSILVRLASSNSYLADDEEAALRSAVAKGVNCLPSNVFIIKTLQPLTPSFLTVEVMILVPSSSAPTDDTYARDAYIANLLTVFAASGAGTEAFSPYGEILAFYPLTFFSVKPTASPTMKSSASFNSEAETASDSSSGPDSGMVAGITIGLVFFAFLTTYLFYRYTSLGKNVDDQLEDRQPGPNVLASVSNEWTMDSHVSHKGATNASGSSEGPQHEDIYRQASNASFANSPLKKGSRHIEDELEIEVDLDKEFRTSADLDESFTNNPSLNPTQIEAFRQRRLEIDNEQKMSVSQLKELHEKHLEFLRPIGTISPPGGMSPNEHRSPSAHVSN